MAEETENVSAKFVEAEQLENDGRRVEAIGVYSDIIREIESRLREESVEASASALSTLREQLALAYNNRGICYYMEVEFRLAIEDYTKALEYHSEMARTYCNRGVIHYRLGRFQEAVEDMRKTLSLLPDFEPAQQCLKQCFKELEADT
ncbi:hypothetical protein BaRGS_00021429 [Batillaria attramentaria]|uniref:Tetratricopeptide repeat protein n=1 Tax=Batillaria attramentaria TaxID=370345 RepID=A0ABD0KJV8_9CAEN